MKKWYVGKKQNGTHEVFSSEKIPTETSHGRRYRIAQGPFKTKTGAQTAARIWNAGNQVTQDQVEDAIRSRGKQFPKSLVRRTRPKKSRRDLDKEYTRVLFRVFKDDGSVIAFFPDVKEGPGLVSSYMHLGQHGSASYPNSNTRPATPNEYAPLARELKSLGYRLKIAKRKSKTRGGPSRRDPSIRRKPTRARESLSKAVKNYLHAYYSGSETHKLWIAMTPAQRVAANKAIDKRYYS